MGDVVPNETIIEHRHEVENVGRAYRYFVCDAYSIAFHSEQLDEANCKIESGDVAKF